MRICGVSASQQVVNARTDEFARAVTQAMFDRVARPAQICPFVADSIDRDLCWLEEYDHTQEVPIKQLLAAQADEFCKADPSYDPAITGQVPGYPFLWKTFVSIFPNIPRPSGAMPLFDKIHGDLKTDYMKRGLMIGQFYYGCPQGGIYNPAFLPLYSPYPLFAIRYMAKHDHLFFDPKNAEHAKAYDKFFPKK
jgi:hypothetical protein